MWGQNPLDLLRSTDIEWLILMACAKVVEQDRERERRELDKKR